MPLTGTEFDFDRQLDIYSGRHELGVTRDTVEAAAVQSSLVKVRGFGRWDAVMLRRRTFFAKFYRRLLLELLRPFTYQAVTMRRRASKTEHIK